jgi:hypothetical protein
VPCPAFVAGFAALRSSEMPNGVVAWVGSACYLSAILPQRMADKEAGACEAQFARQWNGPASMPCKLQACPAHPARRQAGVPKGR